MKQLSVISFKTVYYPKGSSGALVSTFLSEESAVNNAPSRDPRRRPSFILFPSFSLLKDGSVEASRHQPQEIQTSASCRYEFISWREWSVKMCPLWAPVVLKSREETDRSPRPFWHHRKWSNLETPRRRSCPRSEKKSSRVSSAEYGGSQGSAENK